MTLSPSPALIPLASLYGIGVGIRNWAYDRQLLRQHPSSLPVVCVGNATAGGSGKSPFVDYFAASVIEARRRPVILSRGYGGQERGPLLVRADHLPAQIGDEPLMHFRYHSEAVPVVVSASRVAGVKFIEEKKLGDIVILDDGYQHRALARSVNLLLLDLSSEESRNRWLHGRLLPAGYLREPLEVALARATAVIFIQKSEKALPIPERILPDGLPAFRFTLKPESFVDVYSGERLALNLPEQKKSSALTAIASATSFFENLHSLGIPLEQSYAYPDHHLFSGEDWAKAQNGVERIFCTEKDAVKLRPFLNHPGKLYALSLEGRFDSETDHERFWNLCLG